MTHIVSVSPAFGRSAIKQSVQPAFGHAAPQSANDEEYFQPNEPKSSFATKALLGGLALSSLLFFKLKPWQTAAHQPVRLARLFKVYTGRLMQNIQSFLKSPAIQESLAKAKAGAETLKNQASNLVEETLAMAEKDATRPTVH